MPRGACNSWPAKSYDEPSAKEDEGHRPLPRVGAGRPRCPDRIRGRLRGPLAGTYRTGEPATSSGNAEEFLPEEIRRKEHSGDARVHNARLMLAEGTVQGEDASPRQPPPTPPDRSRPHRSRRITPGCATGSQPPSWNPANRAAAIDAFADVPGTSTRMIPRVANALVKRADALLRGRQDHRGPRGVRPPR